MITIKFKTNAFFEVQVWYKITKQYPSNKRHNIELFVSPAGIPLGLRTRAIRLVNQLCEYCVFDPTGIGSCYIMSFPGTVQIPQATALDNKPERVGACSDYSVEADTTGI